MDLELWACGFESSDGFLALLTSKCEEIILARLRTLTSVLPHLEFAKVLKPRTPPPLI